MKLDRKCRPAQGQCRFLRRETPEKLWVKCPESGELVFHKDLEANLFVVPGSALSTCASPRRRGSSNLFDGAAYEEIATPEVPLDPLKFRDVKRYTDRLKEYRHGKTDTLER